MSSKKERLAKIREQLYKIVEGNDMNGIIFFGGVSPDDQDEGDHDIPMFYSAAGPHILLFSLVGKMMADLAIRLEKEQGSAAEGNDVKQFVLGHMIASLNAALYPSDGDPGIESKDGLPPGTGNEEILAGEEADEFAARMAQYLGKKAKVLIVNKKGGNA